MTEETGVEPSDESFGQRSPPLYKLIYDILKRYHDGGQILKELIQNADDAGATEVRFLYDYRSFNTQYLASPDLRKFQGPAFYAYNDAKFKPDDWEGIQNLMQSNKVNDPLKVGQFGIGFNSVYHITDLPGIVSGNTIGFLDPHKMYFELGEPGKKYKISDRLLSSSSSSRDQFSPFQGIYKCDLAQAKSYDGTLFRFPLRTEPSKLSKKKYTKEMIEDLFDSLRQEASVILLFLKSVQRISVDERTEDGEIKCVFNVEIAEETRERVRKERQQLLNEVLDPKVAITDAKYMLDVLVTSSLKTTSYKWLVLNQIGSNKEQVTTLATSLRFLPWVGCAVPITDAIGESAERIFCFLPLPPDVDCKSGLPVHLHGYFGVMDNRRGLLWPGSECKNNEKAEWNELLLKEVGAVVYGKILEALVRDEPRTGLTKERRCQLVYSALPDLDKVQAHWKCILKPFFEEVRDHKLFYCRSLSGNSWITLKNGILDRLEKSATTSQSQNTIVETLVENGIVIITDLPTHVKKIVDQYFGEQEVINPARVRDVLKSPDAWLPSRNEEKMFLLDYVLSDNPTTELSGVPLLPLEGGQFITFRPNSHASDPSRSVFVPSGNCKAALLPTMSTRFLDERLSDGPWKKLSAMAATETNKLNPTQLVKLTKDIVVQNLHASLPPKWSEIVQNGQNDKVEWIPNHPPETWLDDIWHWIHASYPDSLSLFQGIPLISLPVRPNKCLGILRKNSKFIFASNGSGTHTLPSQVASLLSACGCTVICDVPAYLCHPDINSYIASPTPVGAITVLSRASLETVQNNIKQMSRNNRCVLREFFCRLPESLSIDLKNFLLQLPMFDTLSGCSSAVRVSGQTLEAASPEFKCNLPSGFHFVRSHQIISADPKSSPLLTSLAVEILKPAKLLVLYLFPDILIKSVYTEQETFRIMLWTLQQMPVLKSQYEGFCEELKALPFVPTDEGELRKPSELYDPKDALLLDLFSGETSRFPTGDFTKENVILPLKELGLRTRNMLTAVELLEIAVTIASASVSQSLTTKVEALVKILGDEPAYLNKYVEGGELTLKDKLLQLKWLPSAKGPPRNTPFPESLPWYDSNSAFFSPTELRSKTKAFLIGSSMPILDVDMNEKLQEEFGLTSNPPVHLVVKQLAIAVKSFQQQEQDRHQKKVTSKLVDMLLVIYVHFSQLPSESVSIAIDDACLKRWIWQGAGFCSPAQLAFETDFHLDLRPQLFLLPDDFKDEPSLQQFFLSHGVRENFSEGDILGVLNAIRDKHERLPPEVNTCTSEVESDLNLCRSILEWVVRKGEILEENLQGKVFVPVQNARNALVLEPCKKCTYCDHDWLRRGGSELDIPGDYCLIHEAVPLNVARLLGVPALSTCLLSAETLGFEFEQTGPHEPITTRLNNILKEYKEGVGVFKELIQNADDAGASKVRFLVDWRHGPKEKLLSPKMAECQGPALWAYNNAVFTDKDFQNINKLAGATKVEDLAKIGRFGLGFNAVYHLTDVPSFVSREYFVMFDPNVHHLQSHIKDKSRPGIRINLATNPRPLLVFEDQFQPYQDIFGCNTQCTEGENFYCDGTLFRFPFRTADQASESEVCQKVYDEENVKKIVSSLKECSSLLLLYTQHVNDVELYELDKNYNQAGRMQLVLAVKKNVPVDMQQEDSTRTVPFIKECSDWWAQKLTSEDLVDTCSPFRSELLTIDVNEMLPIERVGNKEMLVKRETWLLSSCVGTGSSARLGLGEGRSHGLLPCAGAAAKLSSVSGKTFVDDVKLIPEAISGEAFCFLPLSCATGFPVHVNGYFAITSNRRGIWERGTSDQCLPIEVKWNESLMEDALTRAYVQLLLGVKRFLEEDSAQLSYSYGKLWPCYKTLKSSTWGTLVKSVYTKIVEEALPLFWSHGKWLDIHRGHILDEDLREAPGAVEILNHLEENVFHLTPEVRDSFMESGQTETLRNRTLTLENFFMKFFFPNITKMPNNLRDPIVWFGLDRILSQEGTFAALFEENACICCSEDGVHLAKPCELVSPRGAAANLFSIEDRRFPVGEAFLTDNRLYVLEKLGMVKDKLSWHEICGRAKSVEKLAEISYRTGLKRVKNLIKYLRENIEILEQEETADKDLLEIFQATKFMPFAWNPLHLSTLKYTLPWEGSRRAAKQFFAAKDLFLPIDVHLVGSCCLIVDDSDRSGCDNLGERVKALLGFGERRPSNEQVLQQLDIAINQNTKDGQKPEQSLTETVCKKVYKHLNAFVSEATNKPAAEKFINIKLREKSWLYIQGRFVASDKVAFNWKGVGAPYLHGLSDDYRKYGNLFRAAGVKEDFVAMDFINALLTLSELKKGTALDKDEMKLTVAFVNELKHVEGHDVVKAHVGKIPLPDSGGVLAKSEELTINEAFWLTDRGDARYVHDDIPPKLALDLGAKLLLDRRRNKYANDVFMPFGQYEELTNRIKNILKSYPCDSGILKELVQNAEDAKATEIHFVYDTRVLPHERAFQLNAKLIQGPALCVYNDRPFSDKDMEGIQNLGIGTKADDVEKAGQYGIGFNAVYHLTDCPSFISDGETLCLFDPHRRYAPQATLKRPGGKFGPINDEFKEDFSDTFRGYLSEYFQLKGSTMFRLPLRTAQCHSQICNDEVSDREIRDLFSMFRKEGKKMLLFLSHVKKIALSVLDSEGNLKKEYEVVSSVDEENEGKRLTMTSLIKEYKDRPTHEIPWKGVMYSMSLTEPAGVVEKWLIHQCCGSTIQEGDNAIPDGRPLGLFPRGGIAALVSSTASVQREYVAYCFLPLPVKTSLPVHVNGHFALDASRRNLWIDTDFKRSLTKWNDFMKTRVLAPGYAALITEARNCIPHCKRGPNNQYYFQNETDAETGLMWYHGIFPNIPSKDSAWSMLTVEVYRCLGSKEAPVLPVVGFVEERRQVSAIFDINIGDPCLVSQPRGVKSRATRIARSLTKAARSRFGKVATIFKRKQTTTCRARMIFGRKRLETKTDPVLALRRLKTIKSARTSQITHSKTERAFAVSLRRCGSFIHVPLTQIIKWLPAHEAFFIEPESKKKDILETFPVLLRTDMPLLLFSLYRIYAAFRESGTEPCLVNPKSVIDFLLTSQSNSPRCKIGKLPNALKTTNIGSKSGLHHLISYCKQEKQFPGLLEGLPLLLTADSQLRHFDSSKPVYLSKFSDLFPTKADLFVHPEFVDELLAVSRQQNDEKLLDLTASVLASFFPDVFPPELKGCTKHVAWTFPESGVLSETWFKRLWEFLENYAKPGQNTLRPLGEWPIIPTSCGKLVTINNAKSVLDMSKSKTEYGVVGKIREILKRLDCPTLRKDITKPFLHVRPELPKRPRVLDAYVAHPDKAVDVLQVLAYMNKTGGLHTTKLNVGDIHDLLLYFQDECENHVQILKELPFYKAIDDGLHALLGYASYVTVPCGIATTEMKKLQDRLEKRCLLLHPDWRLDRLYEMLGVETTCDPCDFYQEYVLPYFGLFSRKCQIEHLSYIKNRLASSSNQEFLTFLKSTRCIPNEAGGLYYASDFYHPHNEVFKIMLDPNNNQFLSAVFDDFDWLRFLIMIGLEQDVSEHQFLEFCRKVERHAATSEDDEINRKRSNVLVRYLFDNRHLHEPHFLTSVSHIQFIASEKVEDALFSLHKQHQYDETKKKLQYVQFRNSVPWEHRQLVWTSVQLLPEWAQPSYLSRNAQHLRVQGKPSIETVTTHLETISNAYAKMGKKEKVLPNFDKLKYIMVSIYKFLHQSKECDGRELSDACSSACQKIGHRLTSVPCVFLEDEKALVEGEKLSFTVPPDRSLKPFFHTVPREYGVYQHLLKRLGATEVVTSSQMANVLKAIRDDCVDGKISTKYEKMVCDAMFLFFQSIITAADKKASKISQLTELYLSSEAQFLVRSNELVSNVPPRLVQVVARQKYHVLFPLEKCGLKRGREREYLEAIPERLRPKPLDTLVCEVLNPACRNETCVYFDAESCCTFIQRYTVLLKSTQFRRGLVRLSKHQRKMSELPDEEKENAARFSSGKVEIKCMKTIETHLVYVKDQTPLEKSFSERVCYVTGDNDSWTLYIQHEFGGKNTKAILGKSVKEIVEGCVEDTSELADMLSCDMPSQIPGVLSVHDVSRDFSEEEEELGEEVSAVYHYLMLQNPMCLFEEGALVAYAVDTCEDERGVDTSEDGTVRYILAKIIKRVDKSGEIRKAYDFLAEYCIDVGSGTETVVSVLDLYEFQEGHLINSTGAFEGNSSFINVDEEKHEVRKVLWEARRLLSSQKRLKVLRRLYFYWIRARNFGNTEVATEIIELLLADANSVVEEMTAKDGPRYSRFRMNWERQEAREREAYNNFRRSYIGPLPCFSGTLEYVNPEPEEASRWIEQSQVDLKVARFLHSNVPPFYPMVCFMSEQVVEKCLKAALYAKCGLGQEQLRTHDVCRLATAVSCLGESPKDAVDHAYSVANYYLPTRYPNRQPAFKVPANEFRKEHAEKALEAAGELLESIKTFVSG